MNKKIKEKTAVKIIRGNYEGSAGFIISENWDKKTDSSTYNVKLENGETHTFFKFQLHHDNAIQAKSIILNESVADTVKRIGSISTVFTEINEKLLKESFEPSAIGEVTHKDVTNKHFINWFFKLEDWVDETPREFPFSIITHSDDISVYGYFSDGKLDGLIRVYEDDDNYELSFFCVNPAVQHQGVGQYLFQFILNKFKDKKIILYVYKDSSPAIHIYKKYGFIIVKTGYGRGYFPKKLHYTMQKDKNYV